MAVVGKLNVGEAFYFVGGCDIYGQRFAVNTGSSEITVYDYTEAMSKQGCYVHIEFRNASGVFPTEGWIEMDAEVAWLDDLALGYHHDSVLGGQSEFELKYSSTLRNSAGAVIETLPAGTRISTSKADCGSTYSDYMYINKVKRNGSWTSADNANNSWGFVNTGIKTRGSGCSYFHIKHDLSC
jgi:hypothetical protein